MIERFYLEILQKIPMACVLGKVALDGNGAAEDFSCVFVNEAFERMTGKKSKELIGKRSAKVLPEIKNSEVDLIRAFGDAARTADQNETDVFANLGDRKYKIKVFSPEEGYFVSMFQDVTDETHNLEILRRQAEEINDLTEDAEMIFNNTPDGMFLIKFENDEFRYVRLNETYGKYIGSTIAEAKGKTPIQVLGKERGERAQKRYQECIDSGTTVTFEHTIKTPQGELVWMSSYVPIRKNGVVKYIVGSKVNITELKKANEGRNRAAHWMNAMFHEHSAMMFMLEPLTGKIIDANPSACSFFGYTKEELLRMNISEINMLSDGEVQKMGLNNQSKSCRHDVLLGRLKNNEVRIVDAYTCPISYESEEKHFSIIFDVTDREQYKQELYREKEILKITLDSIGDGVVSTDKDGYITGLNLTGQEITGWTQEEAVGKLFTDVFWLKNEENGAPMENPVENVLNYGKRTGFDNHAVLVNRHGHHIPIADSAAPIKDSNGQVYGTVMVFRDIGKEKQHLERILYLSFHDALTGLYNRRFIEEEMKRLDVSRQLPIAVIMGDVNGLKITNDVFGHEAGDALLRKVGEAFKEVCRKEDIAARWGGDEFLFLLPKISATAAQNIIGRIKEGLAKRSEGSIKLSVSFGSAIKVKETENIINVIQQAEESMYHHKLLEGHNYKNSLVNSLLTTLYEKSIETKEHSERLRTYCQAIGRLLNLDDFDMKKLTLLSLIHDIGNVAIDPGLLHKPAALSQEERFEMMKHPEIGYRIALNSLELSKISNDILSHHERWDGKGYPRGIKGEEIPLLCRILAVADAYDAMTCERSYRNTISKEEALGELKRNSGTQFDEKIVRVFVDATGNHS